MGQAALCMGLTACYQSHRADDEVCSTEEIAPRCSSEVFPPEAESGLSDVVLCHREGELWVSAVSDLGRPELVSCAVDASGELHLSACGSERDEASVVGPRRCSGDPTTLRALRGGRRPTPVSLPPEGECAPAVFGTNVVAEWPTRLETDRLDGCEPPIVVVTLSSGGLEGPDGCRVRPSGRGELVVEVASRVFAGTTGPHDVRLACAAPSIARGDYTVRNPRGDRLGSLRVD